MKAEAEKKAAAKASTAAAQAAKTAVAAANKQDEESDDDEEGRFASIGRNKRKAAPLKAKAQAVEENKDSQEDGQEPSKEVPMRQAPLKGKKKATSYLDELLAERAKKRKKR